jgi:hypothetical protein
MTMAVGGIAASTTSQQRGPEEQINGDLEIATTAAARAIYLAGFTYLRLRLYANTPNSDFTFFTLIAMSFCLSVLSAALSLIFKFFLDRCHTLEQKYEFDSQTRAYYVKGAYTCFLLALLFFCIGLSRIGWVYFVNWNSKYISLSVFLFGALAILITIFYIRSIKRTVSPSSLPQTTLVPSSSRTKNNSNGTSEVNSYPMTAREGEDPEGDKSAYHRSGDSLDVFLSKQMDVLIERSIFIGGIAITGVTFYVEVVACQGLGRSYLFFMSLSAICSLFVSGILSTLRIALQDIPAGPSRVRYALLVLPLGQVCFVIYMSSFLFLAIGLMFIGYGVHYHRDKAFPLVVSAIGVGGMILTLLYSSSCHYMTQSAMRSDRPSSSTPSALLHSAPSSSSSSAEEEHVRSTLTASKLIGSICNITSGFVFFNLINYATVLHHEQEGTALHSQLYLLSNITPLILCICISVFDSILQLFANDLETFAHRSLFLLKMKPILFFTQCGTFFAIALVFVSYGLGGIVRFHPNSYIPALTSLVGGLMISTGLLFLAYQRRQLPIYLKIFQEKSAASGATTSSVGSGGALTAEIEAQNPLRQYSPDSITSKDSLSSTNSQNPLPKYKVERYAKRPSVLSILTGCVMFFGGFAYTSIINLNYDDNDLENKFVLFMSLIFVFSYAIVVWGIVYLLYFTSCPTPQEKILYVIITSLLYKTALCVSGLALLSMIVGFCLLGYTKTATANYHSFALTVIGATVFSSLLVMAILGRVYLDYKTVTLMTKSQHHEALQVKKKEEQPTSMASSSNGSGSSLGEAEGTTGAGAAEEGQASGGRISLMSSMSPPPDKMKVLLNQLSATVSSASFIAGNLLYELLFVNPLYRYTDAVSISYTIFAALTFTSAVSAVVITNITLFLIGTLSHTEGMVLAHLLVDHGIELFVFSFTLSALITWMTGAGLLPHATYLQSVSNRWPLTVSCVVSVLMIIYSIQKAYVLVLKLTKDDEVKQKEGKKMREEMEKEGISGL